MAVCVIASMPFAAGNAGDEGSARRRQPGDAVIVIVRFDAVIGPKIDIPKVDVPMISMPSGTDCTRTTTISGNAGTMTENCHN
jgi:hypothetical protein